MQRLCVVALILLTTCGVAQAAARLSPRTARAEVKAQAEDTIGTLLSKDIGSATVRVRDCKVQTRTRATCAVTVVGTSTCSYVAHVHRIKAGDMIWGEALRCG